MAVMLMIAVLSPVAVESLATFLVTIVAIPIRPIFPTMVNMRLVATVRTAVEMVIISMRAILLQMVVVLVVIGLEVSVVISMRAIVSTMIIISASRRRDSGIRGGIEGFEEEGFEEEGIRGYKFVEGGDSRKEEIRGGRDSRRKGFEEEGFEEEGIRGGGDSRRGDSRRKDSRRRAWLVIAVVSSRTSSFFLCLRLLLLLCLNHPPGLSYTGVLFPLPENLVCTFRGFLPILIILLLLPRLSVKVEQDERLLLTPFFLGFPTCFILPADCY